MKISLEEIKRHLIIEDNTDDLYLLELEQVAEQAVITHCNVSSIDDLCDEDGNIKDTVKHAILLLIGGWYNNRESIAFGSPQKVPLGFEYLISLNQKYYGS